jgi:aspartate/glutamate racemase
MCFSAVTASLDVPLLKMAEEDFEALEADQLTVQGMLASRFVKQFVEEVTAVRSCAAFTPCVYCSCTIPACA